MFLIGLIGAPLNAAGGMVGSAVWRALESKGYSNLIGKTSSELDLRNQQVVNEFYSLEKL